jgi:hypothetical protein
MPTDLGNPQWFNIVADADTPANLLQYVGRIVGVPDGTPLPADGIIDSITVSGITLWGYMRTSPGGFKEWVMAAPVNPNVTAVNAIPARGQWTDLTARGTYYSIGQALLGIGVPGVQLRAGLKQLYDAAAADQGRRDGAGLHPAAGGHRAVTIKKDAWPAGSSFPA